MCSQKSVLVARLSQRPQRPGHAWRAFEGDHVTVVSKVRESETVWVGDASTSDASGFVRLTAANVGRRLGEDRRRQAKTGEDAYLVLELTFVGLAQLTAMGDHLEDAQKASPTIPEVSGLVH